MVSNFEKYKIYNFEYCKNGIAHLKVRFYKIFIVFVFKGFENFDVNQAVKLTNMRVLLD